MTEPRPTWSRALPGTVLLLIAAVITYVIASRTRPPVGPAELVYDKTACAECRMHIGEPAFAAQLRLDTGEVLAFDDPGCLLLHVAELPPAAIAGVWFHHLRADEWIPASDVRFVPVEPTPMGFGLGAVRPSDAGDAALDYAAARRQVTGADPGEAR